MKQAGAGSRRHGSTTSSPACRSVLLLERGSGSPRRHLGSFPGSIPGAPIPTCVAKPRWLGYWRRQRHRRRTRSCDAHLRAHPTSTAEQSARQPPRRENSKMALFDDRPRHDASYATYSEDSFSFLNRADGVMWALIRDELDTWFADYSRAAPTEKALDVRARFSSADPRQHFPAWWELCARRATPRARAPAARLAARSRP